MKSLAEIEPYVRQMVRWRYHGSKLETTRIGYSYGLHLFIEGNGFMNINKKIYKVEKYTLIFIRPGQVHSFLHDKNTSLESYSIYFDLWMQPTKALPRHVFFPDTPILSLMTKTEPCEELDRIPIRTCLKSFPDLVELFLQLDNSSKLNFYSEEITNSLMYTLILNLYNIIQNKEPRDYRILQIMNEMERFPERNLSYEEWCIKCNLEKSHFYKLFKKETGKSPKQYLLSIKMKKAAILLNESRKSITFISEQLGYDSIHYFSKQFTEFYGISPTAYRKRNNNY
ncbi:AraC family transcriptional regulator [Bacillus sp. JJ1533]|uniref:AraC family transcriptional regulator n=1 Tax=Bacillus sp. JJ1533 TaxID=3122959 RepID=UPI002FFDEB89